MLEGAGIESLVETWFSPKRGHGPAGMQAGSRPSLSEREAHEGRDKGSQAPECAARRDASARDAAKRLGTPAARASPGSSPSETELGQPVEQPNRDPSRSSHCTGTRSGLDPWAGRLFPGPPHRGNSRASWPPGSRNTLRRIAASCSGRWSAQVPSEPSQSRERLPEWPSKASGP